MIVRENLCGCSVSWMLLLNTTKLKMLCLTIRTAVAILTGEDNLSECWVRRSGSYGVVEHFGRGNVAWAMWYSGCVL
jgi:ABC-type amino acid transport system permease subunit